MLSLVLQILALLAYAATALLALRLRAHPSGSTPRAPFFCGLLAVDLHAVGFALRAAGQAGPDLHFFAALSLVALGMAALTLADSLLRKITALYVVVMPLAALALLPYALLGPQPLVALSWQIQLHAALALLGYAVLSLAALLALMLLVQERSLRRRLPASSLPGLPPLVQTESLLFRMLWAAFGMLSLTLLTGVLYVDDMLAQHLVHKTVFSVLSWAVLAALLFGRYRFGWRGQRAVRLTLLAMLLLLLAFFGSNLVLELILDRK
jgi:ABC-type uncharacterized transport system permease subunit